MRRGHMFLIIIPLIKMNLHQTLHPALAATKSNLFVNKKQSVDKISVFLLHISTGYNTLYQKLEEEHLYCVTTYKREIFVDTNSQGEERVRTK